MEMHSVDSVDSIESDKSLKHELGSIKDLLCCLCLHGAVLAFCLLHKR